MSEHYSVRWTGQVPAPRYQRPWALRAVLSGTWPNWVVFINDAMAQDARRFLGLLR
jgi:hypothetical protein